MVVEETKFRDANRWKEMEIIRPGKGEKDASAPRLLMAWLRVVRGKAQPSEDVSNLVPGQCPTSSCRVLVEENKKNSTTY